MTIFKLPVIVVLLFAAVASAFGQSTEEWLQDYSAMKKYMAEAYANFEWARTKIDLVELDRKTVAGLKQAKTQADAQKVFAEFLRAFHDGHLQVRKPAENNSDGESQFIPKDATGAKACSVIGVNPRPKRFSLGFQNVPGFTAVGAENEPFPSGILDLGDGKLVAIIAIPLFSPGAYPNNCTAAWDSIRMSLDRDCDEECIDRFRAEAEKRLTEKFISQVRELAAKKPTALVVDIALNGGGSDWVSVIAKALSPVELTPPTVRFIRHPHWVKIFESQLADVNDDLKRKDLTKTQRSILKDAKRKLTAYVADARTPCDLSFFWTDTTKKPGCERLSSTRLAGALGGKIDPKTVANLKSRNSLTSAEPYEFEKGIFGGKIYILTDDRTASASEMFVSMLQRANVATTIGSKTFGAGCGYVDGGTRYFLPVSKLQLRMPDCARFRADGVNEVEGIDPDVKLFDPWEPAEAKLRKVVEYLSKVGD